MEVSQSNNFNVKSSVHDYNVRFEDFENSIKNVVKKGDALIIDKTIYDQVYMDLSMYLLEHHTTIIIESSEKEKEYTAVTKYINQLIRGGFKRSNKIVAIGGGVIQDISGYISSILFRGVKWIFYPTTLLAQGDSCIGGKTSINFGKYKNQIGGFYPPYQIIIDTKFLETLPGNQFTSGLGEMAHYFIIEGEEELEFFKKNYNDKSKIEEIISHSLQIKKQMIERDEFDKGPRLIFNYGHSFGHVIESMTDYRVPHGIAVAHGMDMANYVSWKTGLIDEEFYRDNRALIENFWGDSGIKDIMVDFYNSNDYFLDKFIELLKKDKKNTNTHLGLILFQYPYEILKYEILPDDEFKNILREYSKQK